MSRRERNRRIVNARATGRGSRNNSGGMCPMLLLGCTQTAIKLLPVLVALAAVDGRRSR